MLGEYFSQTQVREVSFHIRRAIVFHSLQRDAAGAYVVFGGGQGWPLACEPIFDQDKTWTVCTYIHSK